MSEETMVNIGKQYLQDKIINAAVRSILENPLTREWSLQGFGMLRTYLDKEVRLHIWDSRYKVDEVSEIHTHPWHFDSLVVAGQVQNLRYWRVPSYRHDSMLFNKQLIKCGVGGCMVGSPTVEALAIASREVFIAGETYRQSAKEIHQSLPEDGTVTIVRRQFLDDEDHAYVFFPHSEKWVSAEPREATAEEVSNICQNALSTWF